MPHIDALPPDQRAVLSLLLRQDKSYEEVARLLRMDPEAVRSRALAAVDALGPSELELAPERRAEIADYLLRQQPASERAATRRYLKDSPSARAWARPVASELRLLAGGRLPDVPAEDAAVEEAFATPAGAAVEEGARRTSRTGGYILLVAVAAIVAAVIVIVVNSGGSSSKSDNGIVTTPTTTNGGAGGSTGSTGPNGNTPRIEAQINLAPTDPKSHALAVANVIAQGSQRAFALQAQGLAQTKGFAYAVWLYNSPADAQALGFAPAVKADGRMQAVGALPANAAHFRQMLLTKETTARPSRPGTIVLAGTLGLTR